MLEPTTHHDANPPAGLVGVETCLRRVFPDRDGCADHVAACNQELRRCIPNAERNDNAAAVALPLCANVPAAPVQPLAAKHPTYDAAPTRAMLARLRAWEGGV